MFFFSRPAVIALAVTRVLLTTHAQSRQGNQGTYDTASNADLDNEFGTHSETEVIEKVLREGVLTEGHVSVQPPWIGWLTD